MAAAAIPIALGIAGAGASAIAGASGLGKDRLERKNFGQSDQYNRQAFNYGGSEHTAGGLANSYEQTANDARNRMAPGMDYRNADAARARQERMAGLMAARASGAVPSIAGQQAAMDAQRAMAAQASMAASARGAAGIAMANQQAAGGMANAHAAISQQAQVNAANERMQAEQAAYGAYGGLNSADMQRAQFGGQMSMQNRSQNDQMFLAMQQQAHAVRQAQLDAQMRGQGLLAASYDNQQGMELSRRRANAELDQRYLQGGVASVTDGFKSAMGGMGGGGAAPAAAGGK